MKTTALVAALVLAGASMASGQGGTGGGGFGAGGMGFGGGNGLSGAGGGFAGTRSNFDTGAAVGGYGSNGFNSYEPGTTTMVSDAGYDAVYDTGYDDEYVGEEAVTPVNNGYGGGAVVTPVGGSMVTGQAGTMAAPAPATGFTTVCTVVPTGLQYSASYRVPCPTEETGGQTDVTIRSETNGKRKMNGKHQMNGSRSNGTVMECPVLKNGK